MKKDLYLLQADICKAIAHPTRIQILNLLRDEEKCVCEIFPALEIEQPNVSRHLAILKPLSMEKHGILTRALC